MEAELLNLLALAKDTAPAVWDILIRQALTTGILSFVVGGCTTAASIWLGIKAPGWLEEDYDIKGPAALVGCVITAVFSVVLLPEGILRLANPEYYALITLLP